MTNTRNIHPRIIEGLYCEALALSDEVRAAFDLSGRIEETGSQEDLTRIALSCEALRTTTRMMHAVAWLLNHRAYFMGELSDFQLRRYGRLSPDFPPADPVRMALMAPALCELVRSTEQFYARLLRIDRNWRDQTTPPGPTAIDRLRARLGHVTAA